MFHFFFFSSRRRHTRSLRDWSSDVCSSDLVSGALRPAGVLPRGNGLSVSSAGEPPRAARSSSGTIAEIGRASCRERVEIKVVAGPLKKKRDVRQLHVSLNVEDRSKGRLAIC